MSFDTPAGTRGGRPPNGPLMRWFNKLAVAWIRRTGRVTGTNALVLTTIGRKSGVERTVPVLWFPSPDDSWLIVASAAGAAKHPAWYHNIAANPDKVRIEVGGRTIDVTAEQLHGERRDEAWRQIVRVSPRMAGYQEKTDRQIPVIRLVAKS